MPLARELLGAQELWALRDVSFDVEHGTVLGIIGSNGAGKTTLLKVISKVIAPTDGPDPGSRTRRLAARARAPASTTKRRARENIFMNAAINGIPRAVALERFDDIVEFAEIQEFVDTPLQYFSSGMYLRLAFSVAINMEPSILLADEILAVGDMSFQERCLQRVRELARDTGLTVLFVSHDMEAVSRICDRVIWVKDGTLHRAGEPEDVVTEYQNATWDMLTSRRSPRTKGSSHAGRYGEIRRRQAAVGRRPRDRIAAARPRTSTCASASAPIARRRGRAARSTCSRRACWSSARRSRSWCRSVADTAYEAVGQDPGEPAVRDDLHGQRRHHADSRRGRGARAGRQQGARRSWSTANRRATRPARCIATA